MIFLITYILLFFIFSKNEFRERFIYASIIWSVCAYGIIEVLSGYSALTKESVTVAWGILNLLFAAIFVYTKNNLFKNLPALKAEEKRNIFGLVCAIGILVICISTLIIAIQTIPNNWDSLTYHLPRIEHWIQDKNINFFPTHIPRQLYAGPLSEFLMLQFRLLINGKAVNFVQWFAMVGSIICVSLIAKEMGLKKNSQLLAGLITATIPMGILQSTSTQNNYVLSYWLISACYFYIRLIKKYDSVLAIFFGIVCSLAVLTQPIAVFYLTPFFLYVLKAMIQKKIQPIILVILSVSVLLLNAPHLVRIYTLYGNIIGPDKNMYLIQSLEPRYMLSNLIKNASVHISTFDDSVNQQIYNGIAAFHAKLGLDINVPQTTWQFANFEIHKIDASEDYAGNFIHFALSIISGLCICIAVKKYKAKIFYIAPVWLGYFFLLIVVKNQPWISRFQLPFFVMMAPLIVLTLENTAYWFKYVMVILLSVISIYFIFMNATKFLIGSQSIFLKTDEQNMFASQPDILRSYIESVDYIEDNHFYSIGVYKNDDSFEYPVWYLLQKKLGNRFRLIHVDVDNVSKKIQQFPQGMPDVIMCIQCDSSIYLEKSYKKQTFGVINMIPRTFE